jgi:hypothetical protein
LQEFINPPHARESHLVHLSAIFHDFPKEGLGLKQPIKNWFNKMVDGASLNGESIHPVNKDRFDHFD